MYVLYQSPERSLCQGLENILRGLWNADECSFRYMWYSSRIYHQKKLHPVRLLIIALPLLIRHNDHNSILCCSGRLGSKKYSEIEQDLFGGSAGLEPVSAATVSPTP